MRLYISISYSDANVKVIKPSMARFSPEFFAQVTFGTLQLVLGLITFWQTRRARQMDRM